LIQNSSAEVDIAYRGKKKDGQGDFAILGGLAADNAGKIETSFSASTISIGNGSGLAGGLVANSGGTIENCYALGNESISGPDSSVGGLLGVAGPSSVSATYAIGNVSAQSGYVGGFVGQDATSGGLSNDYWDTTTSGITNLSQGAGNIANDPGITGETTAQLQAGLPAGFDPSIWAENPAINNGLPYLIANPPQ
jgi:hypothetical protein